jgi:RNase P protein component
MDKDLALKVLGKALNITDLRRLENDLEFSSVTRNRVMFRKTTDALDRSGKYLASKIEYTIGLDVLKKYADEKAVKRYKEDYKNAFNSSINDFFASTFFVDVEQSVLEKTVNNLSLGDYTLVDTVYNGKTYFVAWF